MIKDTQPLRVAEAREVAGGLDPEHIGPVFERLAPVLIGHLEDAGARSGMLVGYYDEPEEDGSVGVHVAYEIGEQSLPASDGIDIVALPVIQVASVVHRGSMENVTPVYEALMRWIEDSGYRLAGHSRELYHEMTADGPSVTELQVPITN